MRAPQRRRSGPEAAASLVVADDDDLRGGDPSKKSAVSPVVFDDRHDDSRSPGHQARRLRRKGWRGDDGVACKHWTNRFQSARRPARPLAFSPARPRLLALLSPRRLNSLKPPAAVPRRRSFVLRASKLACAQASKHAAPARGCGGPRARALVERSVCRASRSLSPAAV